MELKLKKTLIALMLILVALVSCLLLAGRAANPESYAATIASIDEKVETVLRLTATSTVASAGISAIPGDTATPIAEKLADFTEYFLLILCVLYAEKYLLTIIGTATFRLLIPIACVLLVVGIVWGARILSKLGVKLALFGLALFVAIPLSLQLSDMIYATYQQSINETITSAEEFSNETGQLSEAGGDEGLIASILSKISETTTSLSSKAADIVNNFVESLAVMIVTSCVIPVLVLLFFVWLIKMLTGIEIPVGQVFHAKVPQIVE